MQGKLELWRGRKRKVKKIQKGEQGKIETIHPIPSSISLQIQKAGVEKSKPKEKKEGEEIGTSLKPKPKSQDQEKSKKTQENGKKKTQKENAHRRPMYLQQRGNSCWEINSI